MVGTSMYVCTYIYTYVLWVYAYVRTPWSLAHVLIVQSELFGKYVRTLHVWYVTHNIIM